MKYLKYFDAGNCNIIEDDSITLITRYNLHLEGLYLSRCDYLTTRGFNNIGESLHGLRKLDVCGCKNIKDQNVDLITKNNKNLKIFDLRHCELLTSLSFKYIDQNLDNLKYLNSEVCRKVDGHYFTYKHNTTGGHHFTYCQFFTCKHNTTDLDYYG